MKHSIRDQQAFALVIVLSLLSMLVLVTYAISLVSKTDAQLGMTTVYQVQARQRALMPLKLAMGELQRAAGPDGRMTGIAGVVGVAPGDPLRQITGVWSSTGFPTWLVSGSSGGSLPAIAGERIVLVGANAVGSPSDRADQELVEAGLIDLAPEGLHGHYAYWVGDEGVKISAGVPDDDAQVAVETGRILRLDAGRVLGSRYDPTAEKLAKAASLESLRYVRTGTGNLSITGAFHTVTTRHRALPATAADGTPRASGYVEGAFNINTTSVPVWRGLLEYPDRDASARGLSTGSALNNSRKITDLIAARGAPFASTAELLSSGLIQAAFDSTPNRVTTMTAQEFVDDVAPILSVRSDTFRIRAYGDAMHPADATLVGAAPEAVAYCEAIVQRTNQPDPLGNGNKFVITYFRWLGPDDI